MTTKTTASCECGHTAGVHLGELKACLIGGCNCSEFVEPSGGENPVLITVLRRLFPHGHPDFIPALLEEMKLHSDKNHDYASGGNSLGNFQRVAKIKSLYPGFPDNSPAGVALTYMLKQLDATMWGMAKGIEHKVEGLESRLRDISVYANLVNILLKEPKDEPII